MQELVTISQIAIHQGVSYHVARNRLNRTPESEQFKQKLGHTVVYDKKVLAVLCKN